MIFGLDKYFLSFFSGTKRGRRDKGVPRIQYLRSNGMARSPDANNNQNPPKETPLRLLKKIWDIKQSANSKNQKRIRRRNTAYSPRSGNERNLGRSRYRYRKRIGRAKQSVIQRPQKRASQKRSYRKRSAHQSKKNNYAKPLNPKVVKVRRVRRYNTGEEDYEHRRKIPVHSFKRDAKKLAIHNPISFEKRFAKGDKDIMDDPLNFQNLQNSYVRKIHGRPAGTSPVRSESKTRQMRSPRRRQYGQRAKSPQHREKKQVGRPGTSKRYRRRRVGRRELNYLVRSHLKEKLEARKRRRRTRAEY